MSPTQEKCDLAQCQAPRTSSLCPIFCSNCFRFKNPYSFLSDVTPLYWGYIEYTAWMEWFQDLDSTQAWSSSSHKTRRSPSSRTRPRRAPEISTFRILFGQEDKGMGKHILQRWRLHFTSLLQFLLQDLAQLIRRRKR